MLSPRLANTLIGAVLLVVALATLTPVSVPPWVIGPKIGIDVAPADLIRNILFFAPLGICLGLRGMAFGFALVVLVGTSLAIELAQLWVPGRTTSAWDVLGNTLGGLAGWLATVGRRFWLVPTRGLAGCWCVLWAGTAIFSFWVMGKAAAPDVPAGPLYTHLPTGNPNHARFSGGEIRAWLGGVQLPRNRIAASQSVRVALLGDFDLRVETQLGPRASGPMNFFMISAQDSPIIQSVVIDGTDLIYTYRTRASLAGLEPATVRLRGMLQNAAPGDAIAVDVSRHGAEACVAVGSDLRCAIGHGAADGWALFVPRFLTDRVPPRLVGWAWLTLAFAPLGLWRRAGPVSWVAAILTAAALAAASFLPTLLAPSWDQALVVPLAYAGGRWLGGIILRARPPARDAGVLGAVP